MNELDSMNYTRVIRHLICVFLLVIIGLFLFLPMLKHWYFADDFHWLEMGIRGIESPGEIFTHRFFNYHRPVVTLSFVFEQLFYGLSAPGHYLMQIILHLINAILVFQIIFNVYRNRMIACVTSMLFLVSPAGIEAVTWISGRTDLLSTSFFLTAVCLLMKPFGHSGRNRWFGNMAFLLSIFAKESAIMLPAVLFLFPGTDSTNVTAKPFKRILTQIREIWVTIVIAIAGLVYHGFLQWKTGPHISEFSSQIVSFSWMKNIIDGSMFTVMAPFEKIFVMGFPGWLGFAIVIVATVALVTQKENSVAKGWVLVIILMLPAALIPFSFLPEPHMTFRRFFYLPGFGASLLWASIIFYSLKQKKRLIYGALGLFLGIMLITSFNLTGQQLHKWNGLTASRRHAMQGVRNTLASIPESEKVVILLPEKSVWREMFHLFSSRPVQAEYISEDLSLELKNKRVFTFQQGALYPVEKRKPSPEVSHAESVSGEIHGN